MKKIISTFFAFVLLGTSSAWSEAITVTKTVDDLITMHEWEDTGKEEPFNVYSSFTLDDVISVSAAHDNSYTKYKNGTLSDKRWFVYQADYNGQFTISAKRGYQIDTVYFEYNTANDATISTKAGKSVDKSYQIPTKGKKAVENHSIILYVGNTGTKTEGMVKITKFSVVYKIALPTDVSMPDSQTVSLGNHFQIGAITPYYTSQEWSTTDANTVEVDQFGVITAKAVGSAIVKVKFADNSVDSCVVSVEENNFTSITDTIKSAVTTESTYYGMQDSISYQGDNGIFQWIMRAFRRDAVQDVINGAPATRICYNSTVGHAGKNYLAYANNPVAMEGGVRSVSFRWKAANSVNPVVFDIDTMGTPLISYKTSLFPDNAWRSEQTYTRDINMAQNGAFRIHITDVDGATLTIGPLTITPYLLYTTKLDSIDLAVATTYKNEGLIDNRDNTDAITYSIVAGDCATVDPESGTVTATEAGEVTVQAKWGDVTTTYTFKAKGSIPTNLMDVDATEVGVRKVVENGQLYIIRNAKTYNAQGKLLR